MRSSISGSHGGIWSWLFKGLGIYLALELGSFLIAGLVLKKTVGQMAGPYLAFAVPAAIIMPLIWWVREWEEQGVTPKPLARRWGLTMVLFVIVISAAVSYSGVHLGLMGRTDAIVGFVTAAPFGSGIAYFISYHHALRIISSRRGGSPTQ